jgi:hypothetical protein
MNMKQNINVINSVINSIRSNINVIETILADTNNETFWNDLDKLQEIRYYLDNLNKKTAKELI